MWCSRQKIDRSQIGRCGNYVRKTIVWFIPSQGPSFRKPMFYLAVFKCLEYPKWLPTKLSVVGARYPSLTKDREQAEQNYYKIETDVIHSQSRSGHDFTIIRIGTNFPGGPVVKTPCFHCRGSGAIPDRGTTIPHATLHSQKEKRKKDYNDWWCILKEVGIYNFLLPVSVSIWGLFMACFPTNKVDFQGWII